MKIKNKITVGSIESGDLMITLEPTTKLGIEIILESNFVKQYGNEIKTIITNELKKSNIEQVKVIVVDQGAIPAVIKARIITAINRANNKDVFNFIEGANNGKN